ncbi:hypothetical protein TIFTF001_056259 [Ficus carica]|uniref:Uncharacterized protein n=1 Tax=Ficus carica TaxID=3494 RepID=A0AA88EJK8_FICCA|nr:hypothetical protein TIFTF001_056259 [Ficus carica]
MGVWGARRPPSGARLGRRRTSGAPGAGRLERQAPPFWRPSGRQAHFLGARRPPSGAPGAPRLAPGAPMARI